MALNKVEKKAETLSLGKLDGEDVSSFVERGARTFLTGEDCTILIARGPTYTWDALRLVANITWQENRTVMPHFGYDDEHFTTASPGACITNGSLMFYRKVAEASPLHNSQDTRVETLEGRYTEDVKNLLLHRKDKTSSIKNRNPFDRNYMEKLLVNYGEGSISNGEFLDESKGKGLDAKPSAKRLAGSVYSLLEDSNHRFPHIFGRDRVYNARGKGYTYRRTGDEPVNLMILLNYPLLADSPDRIYFAAVILEEVYFTGAGASVQNVSVEPLTHSYTFIAKRTSVLDLAQTITQ